MENDCDLLLIAPTADLGLKKNDSAKEFMYICMTDMHKRNEYIHEPLALDLWVCI